MIQPTRGVFYVATGERHRVLTCHAIESLLKTNPFLPVCVFTDDVEAFAGIRHRLDRVIAMPEATRSFEDKIHGFIHAPYERSLFLDSDTAVLGDLQEVFDVLDRFDLAAAHAPGHSGARFHPYESPEIPQAFVQFNTGVVCFKRTPEVMAVLADWLETHRDFLNQFAVRHDQPALRHALYRSRLQLYVLPPEYNLLGGFGYVSGPVKIIHSGAPAESIQALAQAINARTDARLVLRNGTVEYLRSEG